MSPRRAFEARANGARRPVDRAPEIRANATRGPICYTCHALLGRCTWRPICHRWRLAGQLDHEPDDLMALAAIGITALAALEPGPELEARTEIAQALARRCTVTPD